MGRWKVRLFEIQNPNVVLHDDWPNGEAAEGWVNPDYVVMSGTNTVSPASPPLNQLSLLGESLDQSGQPDTSLGAQDVTPNSFSPIGMQSAGTLTGSQFLAQTANVSAQSRESAILAAIKAGHVPSFIGSFVEVSLNWQGHQASVYVSPDYVSIGTDADFVRIPMAAPTAQAVADLYDCTLPRPKLVDAIWRNAQIKLPPKPLPPTSQMTSNEWYKRSNDAINAQLGNQPLGKLVAGHKKDIVLTDRLLTNRNKVAIYGWHQSNGTPIQPLTTVHGASYADYSHGVRLIANSMVVDGRSMKVNDVLQDSELCGLLTKEVNVKVLRYP